MLEEKKSGNERLLDKDGSTDEARKCTEKKQKEKKEGKAIYIKNG